MKSEITTKKHVHMRKARKTIFQLAAIAGCFVLSFSDQLMAQDGEAIFKKNCGVCHKVGGGRLVGPDLMGVTTLRSEDWLMKWTKSSTSLIKSGDADANAIFHEFGDMVMPDQALPEADLKAIFAYIAGKSGGATAAAPAGGAKKEVVADASNTATPEVIESGKNIFLGSQALVNGGPSCVSCHNVNYTGVIPGGLLAKDLTTAYSRLGGDAGLQGILGAPPFPAMTAAYKNKPITEKEIADLTAFFNKVDKDKTNQQVAGINPLLYGGAFGVCGILILIFAIWFKRKKGTVKKDIFNRQVKAI